MKYTFNIDDEIRYDSSKEKKNMAFYLKGYQILQNYKKPLFLGALTIMCYVIRYVFILNHIFLLRTFDTIIYILLALVVTLIMFTILDMVFTTNRLYSKVSKFIGHDILVKELTVFNDEVNDRLEESKIVPGIKLTYDALGISNKKFALTFQLSEDTYKVVDILSCERVENKMEKNVYSDEILKCINETEKKCVSENGVLCVNVVLLKDNGIKPHDIITTNDIDMSLLLSEAFFFPYVHKKKEETA